MTRNTILGVSYNDLKKRTLLQLALCLALVAVTITVNVLLYCFVTKQTKIAFIVINVLLDVAVSWFCLFYGVNVLAVKRRLLYIYRKAESGVSSHIKGEVIALDDEQKVNSFDCLTATIKIDDEIRKVFIIKNTIENSLNIGCVVSFTVTDNIAVICEVENEK